MMMTRDSADDLRRRLAGYCLMTIALLFLSNPLSGVFGSLTPRTSHTAIALIGFAAPVSMLLMVGSLFAITQLLRKSGERRALIGGAITLMGWAVGVRILALGQLSAMLAGGVEGVPVDALHRIYAAAPLVFVSLIPVGLLFSIGLIILGLTLAAARPIHRGVGILLTLGGVLFPLGRAVHLPWAFLACDLILGATFALIGWHVLAQPARWSGDATADRVRQTA
jgi:hypothetical protein